MEVNFQYAAHYIAAAADDNASKLFVPIFLSLFN